MFSLKNKSTIITGGGSGIGKAVALLFAKQGATVHIIELNMNAADAVVNEINAAGGVAIAHGCDVTSQQAVVDTFTAIEKLDILVNNAGIAHVGNVEKTSIEDFDRIYNVNVKGVYNCLFAAVPQMKLNGSGVILNLASIAAIVGITDRFAYSMSKGAVLGMTLSVAKDYIGDGIRCNCISPARVHTPFVDNFIAKNYAGKEKEMFDRLSKTQPIGRMGSPEEIACLILYLCSDEAGFITGSDYNIDGGVLKLSSRS